MNIKRIVVTLLTTLLLLSSEIMAVGKYTLNIHSELLEQSNDGRECLIEITNKKTGEIKKITLGSSKKSVQLDEGKYVLKEVESPEGITPIKDEIEFSVPFYDNGKELREYTIELKHQESIRDVIITKLDKDSKRPLEGVEFYIYKLTEDGWERIAKDEKLITDRYGDIRLKADRGSYRIEEIYPKRGYQNLTTYIYFEVFGDYDTKPIRLTIYNSKLPPEDDDEIPPHPTPKGDGEVPPHPTPKPKKEIPPSPGKREFPGKIDTPEPPDTPERHNPSVKPKTNDIKDFSIQIGSTFIIMAVLAIVLLIRKNKREVANE